MTASLHGLTIYHICTFALLLLLRLFKFCNLLAFLSLEVQITALQPEKHASRQLLRTYSDHVQESSPYPASGARSAAWPISGRLLSPVIFLLAKDEGPIAFRYCFCFRQITSVSSSHSRQHHADRIGNSCRILQAFPVQAVAEGYQRDNSSGTWASEFIYDNGMRLDLKAPGKSLPSKLHKERIFS